ncbi:hypothetical protein M430DRAFT_230150 [Amorphotheca resinae ATCC 22711]|jgi:hypothetical protein|uniref:Secreted protein n=1 Tax=Amorphotheca resinae ATCC 22711 TaxID=857342 RepID=A0A2T3B3E6_AMORE|nr:hypothetical protein M430DRAFT_230150 [Amorphotheca resinae ATCC 22711]PSS20168.1 hypothetical protein M430DRAFT_230150 [Amorphotheca resinae ATCC 22711]
MWKLNFLCLLALLLPKISIREPPHLLVSCCVCYAMQYPPPLRSSTPQCPTHPATNNALCVCFLCAVVVVVVVRSFPSFPSDPIPSNPTQTKLGGLLEGKPYIKTLGVIVELSSFFLSPPPPPLFLHFRARITNVTFRIPWAPALSPRLDR